MDGSTLLKFGAAAVVAVGGALAARIYWDQPAVQQEGEGEEGATAGGISAAQKALAVGIVAGSAALVLWPGGAVTESFFSASVSVPLVWAGTCFVGGCAKGWALDRLEDVSRLPGQPVEMRRRLLRLRRTRQKMPRQELQAWREDYGMNLRSLPPAYSQQWERRLLELGTEGGPTLYLHELIWIRRPDGALWEQVTAILRVALGNGHGPGLSAELAQQLGLAAGMPATYSVGGYEFQGPVRILPAPTRAELEAEANQDAAAAGRVLSAAALALRADELAAQHRRCVAVPAATIIALMRSGVAMLQHD